MKTQMLAVMAVVAASGSAMGSLTEFSGPFAQSNDRIVINGRTGAVRTQQAGFADRGGPLTDVYDNVSSPALAAGTNGGNFLGDEVITTGTGTIREFEFSAFNGGTVPWTRADISIVFFEFDGVSAFNFLAQLDFDNVPLNIAGGGSFGFLTLTDPGVTISNTDVIVALRYRDIVGPAQNQVGQIRSNPPVVGSSDNTFLWGDIGAGLQPLAFASNNNLAYRIAVPAPGAIALVGLGGLLVARRRR